MHDFIVFTQDLAYLIISHLLLNKKQNSYKVFSFVPVLFYPYNMLNSNAVFL